MKWFDVDDWRVDLPRCWKCVVSGDERFLISYHACDPEHGHRVHLLHGRGKDPEMLGLVCRSVDEAKDWCESLDAVKH